jgi:hypothetical protein
MQRAVAGEWLKELRPKNHGVTHIHDWEGLFAAVEAAGPGLRALYLQCQPTLADRELAQLARVLQHNHHVTGVNLGELTGPTAAGWEAFAAAVPSTALIDCYAQPTGGGPDHAQCRALKRGVLGNRRRAGISRGRHPSMWRVTDYRGCQVRRQ